MTCPGCLGFFELPGVAETCSSRCYQRVHLGIPATKPCPDCGELVPTGQGKPRVCGPCKEARKAPRRPPWVSGVPSICGCCTTPLDTHREFCDQVCAGGARFGREGPRAYRLCARCRLPWRPKKPMSFASDLCWICRTPDFVVGGATWRGIKTYRKKQLVARAAGLCEDCGAPGEEAHHVVPQALGGTHALENLKLLCHDCHQGSGWARNHAVLIEAGLVVPATGLQLALAA